MPDSIVKVDNLTSMNGTGIGIPDGTVASPGLKFTADGDSGLYRIGPNDLGIAAGGVKVAEFDSNGIIANVPYACFVDEKAATVSGGTFTSGDWRTRVLNTTRGTNSIVGSSLSSNQFTLPSGTYRIYASAPAYYCETHTTKIRNITDSSDVFIGTVVFTPQGATGDDQTLSIVQGIFTISAQKTFELQHRCGVTITTHGFGRGQFNTWSVNIYSIVEIWKLA